MMDERELDRAIDTAAGRMMAREPGHPLSYQVMLRVRERNTPTPRRSVWIASTACLMLCAAIATLVMSRSPSPALSLPASRPLVVGPPPVTLPPQLAIDAWDAAPPGRTARAPMATRVLPPERWAGNDVSAIEPLGMEPIALSAIDVPMLERETTSIETIDIEPLTIEPLAASND